MEDEKYQVLKDYGLRLISIRPRSKKEISGKLSQYAEKRQFPANLTDKLLNELSELNLVNDEDFASWWTEQRRTFRPKGEKLIRLELLQKGIDKDVIDAVVSDENREGLSDYDLAMKAMEKKLPRFQKLSTIKMKIKIRDFLFRRGFGWEIISKVIDSLVKKT